MPLKNHELLFYAGTKHKKLAKSTKLSLFARNKSERYKISESCIFMREKWKIDTNL